MKRVRDDSPGSLIRYEYAAGLQNKRLKNSDMRDSSLNTPWQPSPSMERSQVYVRFGFIVVFGSYIFFVLLNQPHPSRDAILTFSSILAIFTAGAFLIQQWNRRKPEICYRRITYGIVLDISTTTSLLVNGGEITLPLFPIYLWIIIASGFRYGARFLYLAQALAIIGIAILFVTPDYWLVESGMTLAIIITVGPLPLYIGYLTKRLEKQIMLNALVERDALTGAYNRRYANDYLSDIILSSIDQQLPLSLAMIDIDHFKRINDEHGHLVGDEVLQEVVKRIRNVTRQQDKLIRYGGEEFLLVLQLPLKTSIECAERIRACLDDHPIRTRENDLKISASIGVATLSAEVKSYQQLIQMADYALYRAKEYGRNQVVVFSDTFIIEKSNSTAA